jgi:membrane-bound serine protease (ClpP class)
MNTLTMKLSGRTSWLFLGVLLAALNVETSRVRCQEAERGLFVTVFNPITDASITQIQNMIDRNRSQGVKPLRVVVFDFNPSGAEVATEKYGTALTLARYIKELADNHGITTVAYLRNKTTRHTVLPVLACKDIVMAQDAKIGEVAKPGEIIPLEDQQQYARYAGTAREATVLKMLDPNIVIVSGRKGEQRIYVDPTWVGPGKRPGFEDVLVLDKKILKEKGLALWDVIEASTFQLCQVSGMQERKDVANHYGLDHASMIDDPWGGEKIKACKIELTGVINAEMKQKLLSQLKEVRAKKENTIFLVLDCGGGVAKVAREIADELRELKRDDKLPIRTIAFIPNRAPDLATFIAFGCSEIIMYKGGDKDAEATLGDFGQFLATMNQSREPSNTMQFIRENLREIAKKQGYPELVVDAMLDKDMTLLQVKPKQGINLELMTRQQLAAAGEKDFELRRTLKQPGSLLKLDATLAKELRIAQDTVDNRDIKEVYTRYGLTEKDVRDSKPGWLDDFAAFLRRTEIWLLLIAIGCAGLILELKMPGATIPGLIALICFVLFFWSQAYAHGAMIWLAVGLFVLGLILLAVEIFILPGFGFMGIAGIILVLTGLALATMEKAPSSTEEWTTFAAQLFRIGFSLVAACVAAFFFARYLPKIPYANRLMLSPPAESSDAESEFAPLPGAEQAASLLGQVGVATSMLRPAGMAKIGDIYVDVVTEGGFIEPGTPIQIVEVEGTRIVVKRV